MMTQEHEGTLLPPEAVPSEFLGTARTVRIYLPPSYSSAPRRRYPVLYLHDGQNVFSSAGPDCCFGWGNWAIDKTVNRLVREQRMSEVIVVGVDNSRSRYREYRGRLAGEPPGTTPFDNYARFLVKELKLMVDRRFRTLKVPARTAVMGSSLGGICSVSLAWEYPRTFGLAASLSGSFQLERQNFIQRVLRPYKGRRHPFRLYLDSGVIDYTGDDDDRRHTDAVAVELRRLGWKNGSSLCHYTDLHPMNDVELAHAGLRPDKWHEARTSQHNELYWRVRAWRALTFLFPPGPAR